MSTPRRSNCASRSTRAGSCPDLGRRTDAAQEAKEGGYPAFLADLRDDRAAVPFFGALARSTVFPALLARTTGCRSTPAPRSAAPMSISSSAARAYRPRDQRSRGRRHRRHRRAPQTVRNLHPRGARAMDVGAPEMGRRPRRRDDSELRDNSGRRVRRPSGSARAEEI